MITTAIDGEETSLAGAAGAAADAAAAAAADAGGVQTITGPGGMTVPAPPGVDPTWEVIFRADDVLQNSAPLKGLGITLQAPPSGASPGFTFVFDIPSVGHTSMAAVGDGTRDATDFYSTHEGASHVTALHTSVGPLELRGGRTRPRVSRARPSAETRATTTSTSCSSRPSEGPLIRRHLRARG